MITRTANPEEDPFNDFLHKLKMDFSNYFKKG